MAVIEAINPYYSTTRRRAAARKGWRSRKRRRTTRRRRRNPSTSTRNPGGLPLLQNLTVQDIAVAGAAFLLVQKVSEQAGQTGWADVAVKGLAAVALGLGVEAALPKSKRAAVAAGMVPAALGALSILSGGTWGMVTTGSAHIATGRAPTIPLLMAGVPTAVSPSVMGI